MNLTREEHKNRYLSKFINYLVNDDTMNRIYYDTSYKDEHSKHLQVIKRVLAFPSLSQDSDQVQSVTMFHLETTKAEIKEGVLSAYLRSSKSKEKSDVFKEQAQKYAANQDYEEAATAYYKSILYLPWVEWKTSLGDLLYQKSKCLAQMTDIGKFTPSMVLYLGSKCNKNLELDEKQMQNLKDYQSYLSNREFSSNFLSNLDKIKIKKVYNPSLELNRYFVVAQTKINVKEDIFSEKPWVSYHGVLRRHCAYCNRSLNKYYLCPCPICIDVSYCDWDCQRSDWKNHKYECRLTAHLSQMPIFLIMLRCYVRSEQNPISSWSKTVNYLDEFVQKKDIKCSLNAFRQMIDQKPISDKISSQGKAQYYAFILLAIEFMYVYTACIENKARIENWPEKVNKLKLNWQGSLSNEEVVAFLFEDLRRFTACPYVRFESSRVEQAKNMSKLNRFIYLVSALIPVVRPNCRYNTNLVIRESRLLRATDYIEPGGLLIVAHTLTKKQEIEN